jgi:hypothetical protein
MGGPGIRTHGHASKGNESPTYQSWLAMKDRCRRPSCNGYARYGGRGVAVCDRWRASFEAFLEDMGDRPAGMTLDRISSNGNYEPGNCRWVTPREQARNRRTSREVTANGVTLSLAEWSRKTGIHYMTLRARLDAGWPPEVAVTAPTAARFSHGPKIHAALARARGEEPSR